VVGADIDPIVLTNDELDEAVVIEAGRLPLPDASFDAVLSDYVLEHVEDPAGFLAETWRVLRPGGQFFFRTPNRRHYVATLSRLTPHWFHELVANWARALPEGTHDPWPTFYRMNTPEELREQAAAAGFRDAEIRMCEAEPSYLVFHAVPFLAGVAWERLVNRFDALAPLRANIFGRLQK
jgi:ubiquinone/menaquinone biosynthesis C-methylase UbiE